MRFIHSNRGKSALEQVTCPTTPSVDEIGIPPMRLAYRLAEAIVPLRSHDQVDVIGHKTAGPDFDLCFLCLLGQQIAIDLVISVFKKDRLAPISALRHVVRQIRNHKTRRSGHPRKLTRKRVRKYVSCPRITPLYI